MLRLLGTAVLTSLFLFSCGDDDDDDEPTPASRMVGTWTTSCQATDDSNAINSIVFTETTFELTITLYSDSNCTIETLRNRYTGTFTAGDGVSTPESSNTYDHTFTNGYQRIKTELFAAAYNTAATCGFTDWQADVEKEITSAGSCAISTTTTTYDVIKIESTQITFGNTSGDAVGTTAATRPTTLETVVYTKQ